MLFYVSRETLKEVKIVIKWFTKSEKTLQDSVDLIEKCSVYYIPCDKIRSNAMRSRCDFNEDKLVQLAYSIKKYGIIEPLCVRTTEVDDSYDYELIAGERRLRAARLANLSVVPCIIFNAEMLSSAELSIIENVYSESLNPFELAAAFKRISDYGGVSFEELGTRLSIPQSDLSNKAWLLELTYEERQILLNSNASEKLSVAIAMITDRSKRAKVIESILDEDAREESILAYINSLDVTNAADANYAENNQAMPRDVSSIIKSVSSKINFLNRHKKRGKMNFNYQSDGIKIEIYIKY